MSSSLFRNTSVKKIVPLVLNKEQNMFKVRIAIHGMFVNDIKEPGNYICFTHTYAAWKNLANIRSIKELKEAIQKNSYSAQNPYGHSLAEFFTFRDGKLSSDIIMNVGVNNFDRKNFINFYDSAKYYLNNATENLHVGGNHQGGLMERSYISVVIKSSEEEINKLTSFYQKIKDEEHGEFRMASHLITNKLVDYFPHLQERGNCCYWTSKGFVDIGMLNQISNFPMACFYKLLLNIRYKKNDRFKKDSEYRIVFYEGLKHHEYPKGSFIYPFYWLKHGYRQVWHVELLANLKVKLQKQDDIIHELEVENVDINKNMKWITECYDKIKKLFIN